MPRIIALCGAKGSGRKTVASIIHPVLAGTGNTVITLPFTNKAEQITAFVHAGIEFYADSRIDFNSLDATGLSRKQIMEKVIQLGLDVSVDYWTNQWRIAIEDHYQKYDYIIVPDYTSIVEYEVLLHYNITLIHIVNEQLESELDIPESKELNKVIRTTSYKIYNDRMYSFKVLVENVCKLLNTIPRLL